MYLKKSPWAEEFLSSSSSHSSSSTSSSSSPSSSSSSATLVVDLVKSLNRQRLYRELTLTLTTSLHNASAEFSFVRSKGLSTILKFLSSLSESDHMIELFQETQTLAHLQVVPVLFANSLATSDSCSVQTLDHSSEGDSTKVRSPPTDNEVTLALRVLEGCCLLDRGSRTLAHQYMAIKEFERCHGVRKIAQLAKIPNIDEKVRMKSAEFLLLLVGNFLPSTKFVHSLEYEEERGEGLQMESLQDDIIEVLGFEIASLLWTVGQLGSFDSQKKQPSLQYQAQHLVDCLDSQLQRSNN